MGELLPHAKRGPGRNREFMKESVLMLTAMDCGMPKLKRHNLGLGPIGDFDLNMVRPIRSVFEKVWVYDLWKAYAEQGVLEANAALLRQIREFRPTYLLWPTMMYEVLERTLEAVRELNTLVVGWFFDDEFRFEPYSRWWTPYLDFCLTNDPKAVVKYRQCGVPALHFIIRSNPDVYRRLDLPLIYDVTFVGTNFGNRGAWMESLAAQGIRVNGFGLGWESGRLTVEEMVRVFNQSRINLCFTQAGAPNAAPQLKDRIFHVCMAGGFLLCERVDGLDEFFQPDEEIVLFKDLDEAARKIRFYLAYEEERRRIAEAGWRRSQREHTQQGAFAQAFNLVREAGKRSVPALVAPGNALIQGSPHRVLPSQYHRLWAEALMQEAFPPPRWRDELDLALYYDSANAKARRLRLLARLPAVVVPALARLYQALGRMKSARLRALNH